MTMRYTPQIQQWNLKMIGLTKNKSTIFQGSIFSSSICIYIYNYIITILYETLGSFPSQQTHGFFLAPIACDMVAPSTVKTIEPLSKAAKVSVFFRRGEVERISPIDGLYVSPVLKKNEVLGPRFKRLQPQFCLAIV